MTNLLEDDRIIKSQNFLTSIPCHVLHFYKLKGITQNEKERLVMCSNMGIGVSTFQEVL